MLKIKDFCLIVVGAVIIFFCFIGVTMASEKKFFIAETMANPEGTDSKENEYFILKNLLEEEKDLAGYKICNIKNYCYSLNLKIPAQACAKLTRSVFLFTLYNDEERISLFDSSGALVDEIYFKNALSGKPWICDENNCDFGLPVSDCDYNNIFETEEDIAVEDEESPVIGNIELKNFNVNSNKNTPNKNLSSSDNQNNAKIKSKEEANQSFLIKNKADFRKAKKIIEKNKESLPVSLSAQAVIPKNVLGKSVFYLLSESEWLKGQTYASFCKLNNCEDLNRLLSQRSFLLVENAYLNWSEGIFSLNFGKDTVITRQEYSEDEFVSLENLKSKDLRKKAGRKIEIKGEIILKKGNYFYVKAEQGETLTFYVPTQILTDWLAERRDLVKTAFPDYAEEKNRPNIIYKGAKMRAGGVIEARKGSYRIIVTSFRDLDFEWPNKNSASSSEQKTKISEQKRPENENLNKQNPLTESEKISENPTKDQTNPDKVSEAGNLNKLLAGKLLWLDLIKIFSLKIWAKL